MVFFKRWFSRPKKELDKESGTEDTPSVLEAESDSPPESPESPPESAEEAAPEQKIDSPPESPLESAEEATPTEDNLKEDASEDIGWLNRLRQGLGKSTARITAGLAGIIGKPKLDMADLTDIEDALIMADLGTEAAGRIAKRLQGRTYPDGVNRDTLATALADELAQILAPVEKPLEVSGVHKPHVILMVGVNGSGKTTTAGKLAEFFRLNGLSVILAAADTFRAAAAEQLQIWGVRTGTKVITGGNGGGGDAAAVAYQALEEAAATGVDVVIIDTAGRLQTRAELMDELAKIHRVIGKRDATAPHDSIIVLDGTVGQNALPQVEAFRAVAGLTGMIITKLDGTARGGIVVALAQKYGLPVHAVGVGEQKEDLQPFEAAAFASALAGVDAPS